MLNTIVTFNTNDEEWYQAVSQLWGPFRSDQPESGTSEFGKTMSIQVHGGRHVATFGSATTEDQNPWQIAEWLRHQIVELAVEENDWAIDLHAAGLVREGACLLVAGGSGTGKTSLSIALCQEGWRLLSDDLCPIDKDNLSVVPFPKPLSIKSIPVWRSFSASWAPPNWEPEPVGGIQAPATVLPLQNEGRPPTHIVFCSHEPRGSEAFQTISPAEAATYSGQLVRKVNPRTLRLLTDLTSGVSLARMSFSDAADGAGQLASFCEGTFKYPIG